MFFTASLIVCFFCCCFFKDLLIGTYVFSTVWNNAWLIDIKDKHFKQFLEVEKCLCKYKGQEIGEKVSKIKDDGGL